jgi:zona occludens toxin (predicted ATPase)
MIIGYVGTPGSGKTYEAVSCIIENLRKGRKVYTNIKGLDIAECRKRIEWICYDKKKNIFDQVDLEHQLVFMPDNEIITFWNKTDAGSLIVIDEIHLLFSNRGWQSNENKEFGEWCSTHRHQCYDLIMITQDIDKVEKHARSVIEWTYLFRKINQFGSFFEKSYLVRIYQGPDHQGVPTDHKKRLYRKSVFDCYKSYDSEDLAEQKIVKSVNLLKHPVFLSVPIVVIAFFFFLFKSPIIHGKLVNDIKPPEIVKKSSDIHKTQDSVKKSQDINHPSIEKQKSAVVEEKSNDGGNVISNEYITKYYLSNNTIYYSNLKNVDLKPGIKVVASVKLEQ